MRAALPLGLAVGVLVAGALIALSASHKPASERAQRRTVMDIAARVIEYVSNGESKGKFWAQNRNTDGQGLSYGILQWTQRSGALGRLLAKMSAADPRSFVATFGPDANLLLQTTTSTVEAMRMSLPLWAEPWTRRFTSAGQIRAFQLAQAEAATTGASWQAALDIARIFNTRTERAMVLFFDRANHHGGYGAKKLANALKLDLVANGPVKVRYPELLRAYATRCAAPYRRKTAPDQATTSTGKTWRPFGGEWHLFAGKADLYAIIVRRTNEILADASLADVSLELA